ncbi:hypothetical protein BC739_008839 [Kutzneria viridogrisea]|uniref:Uncharacterized protein n=1 Tax=Kutzneria viridogrisea TaxID=47990 RepID=A0ABR6BXF8_9PSEU|nr:hypothetical protein [Kutzneria viridogrisea]
MTTLELMFEVCYGETVADATGWGSPRRSVREGPCSRNPPRPTGPRDVRTYPTPRPKANSPNNHRQNHPAQMRSPLGAQGGNARVCGAPHRESWRHHLGAKAALPSGTWRAAPSHRRRGVPTESLGTAPLAEETKTAHPLGGVGGNARGTWRSPPHRGARGTKATPPLRSLRGGAAVVTSRIRPPTPSGTWGHHTPAAWAPTGGLEPAHPVRGGRGSPPSEGLGAALWPGYVGSPHTGSLRATPEGTKATPPPQRPRGSPPTPAAWAPQRAWGQRTLTGELGAAPPL